MIDFWDEATLVREVSYQADIKINVPERIES